MAAIAEPSEEQRDESEAERLDRNTTEMLNELRVASTGIQVMFAFLLMFRRGQKAYLVATGTRLEIVATAFLAAGLTGILVLVSNFVFGTVAAVTVGVLAAAAVAAVWFGLPLHRRRTHHPPDPV